MRKKLLDLTSRNRLLNFPIQQKGSSLRVVGASPDSLYDTLVSEKALKFHAVPQPTMEQLVEFGYLAEDEETGELKRVKSDPDARTWAKELGFSTSYEFEESGSRGGKGGAASDGVQVLLFAPEMEARLRNIRSKANTALEEMGAGILYFSMGFLEWFESEDSKKSRLAPLFNIPVFLKRGLIDSKTGVYKYTAHYTGQDIISNLSLREKMFMDFGISLPDISEEDSPYAYLDLVESQIKQNKPAWKVNKTSALTLLNFGKMLMYLDLDKGRWPDGEKNIISHPVIDRFFRSQESSENEGGLGVSFEHNIDEIPDIHESYPIIDDADSSQHSAMIDALKGDNLVIEGPPGTGKSQTITNLIAAAMHQGKKVLFVAEKMAALEVVKKRLDRAGLGVFCLELHSHKSQKKKVISDLQERLTFQKKLRSTRSIDAEIARYEQLKNELNVYAKEINSTWKSTGKTIHEIFSAAARFRREVPLQPKELWINGLDGDGFSEVERLKFRDQVREFKEIHSEMKRQIGDGAKIETHPWHGIESENISFFDSERVVALIEDWQKTLSNVLEESRAICDAFGLDNEELVTVSQAEALEHDFKALPKLTEDELLVALSNLDADTCKAVEYYLEEFESIQNSYSRLSRLVDHLILNKVVSNEEGVDLNDLIAVTGAEGSVLVSEIARKLKKISSVEGEIKELSQSIDDFKEALPPNLASQVGYSKEGLQHTLDLLTLISGVDTKLLSLRSSHLDDDEIDSALDEMALWLGDLSPKRELVDRVFSSTRLPFSRELKEIKNDVDRPGLGKWFDGDWWAARKRLTSLSSLKKPSISTLMNSIDGAIGFKEAYEDFSGRGYEDVIGPHFRGIDTDVKSLSSLRRWYKAIRKKYGYGFGKKAVLADEILELPAGIIKGAQHLVELGVAGNLEKIINLLSEANEFLPVVGEKLKNSQNLIEGECSASKIGHSVAVEIEKYQEYFKSLEVPVGDAVDAAEELKKTRQRQKALEKNNVISEVFCRGVELKFGVESDSVAQVSRLYATVNFAIYIRNNVKNKKVRDSLLDVSDYQEYNFLAESGRSYINYLNDFYRAREILEEEAGLVFSLWTRSCGDGFISLLDRNKEAVSKKEWLNDWVNYAHIKFEMSESGLGSIWGKVTSGELDVSIAEKALYLAVYDQLSREIIGERPHLAKVSGKGQKAKQKTFREYDEKLKELQSERIASQVSMHRAPTGISGGRKSEYTEMSLINNETGKKTKHIPIRQLLDRAGVTIQELKPCFMMGPMSVAQYIKPGKLGFDLVVMDEASQVKPEDALGVIARGGQLVVVGDPKQLPPTSFFDRQDIGDEDDDIAEVATTNSILDAALPLFKMRRLRWHYRSQHESLIAFSNRNFYHNDLVIFPSPNSRSDEYGIKFHHVVSGRYVNQHNIQESRVVAKAVVSHAFNNQHESLGVVAMNSKQREQIERAIEEECKSSDRVAEAIEHLRDREDGLFIKNLENVQGDERDVIYISFTYGPSEVGGRVYQRFGPINSDVGWRRLNVLFTRSKKRMYVFSSMQYGDILTNEGSKKGVVALRDFLNYAENGKLDSATYHTGKSPDSDFEVAVIDALAAEGFQCDPQVGVAGFFIDIAVKDPGQPGRYLMGIECDGATYHSAKSARDRDRLRQEVLEGLGWRIRRIWSTDWFSNPQGEIDPIIRELQELKSVPIEATDDKVGDGGLEELQTRKEGIEPIEDEPQFELYSQSGELSLREQLEEVAEKVILADFPDTPKEHRLLRPAMIEALVEHEPIDRTEFVEYVPEYIRKATDVNEAKKYLDYVLSMISGNEVEH
ncbi:DUF4011 domain-containing protein [Halomonas ramblicola]|nr:DUF4011 domain-containing anti-phage protein Hhe [Halomonas ramblicola]MDN3520705.1 DUF4011 domain-containing protein [Halomonas ramblicola]